MRHLRASVNTDGIDVVQVGVESDVTPGVHKGSENQAACVHA